MGRRMSDNRGGAWGDDPFEGHCQAVFTDPSGNETVIQGPATPAEF